MERSKSDGDDDDDDENEVTRPYTKQSQKELRQIIRIRLEFAPSNEKYECTTKFLHTFYLLI